MHPSSPTAQRGASLLECVAALSVAAAALHFALPPLQDMVQSASLSAAAQDLLGDLYRARSEALKRNRRVALCKSAGGAACSPEGGWEQGWILFHDENGNGAVDADEEVISRREPLPSYLRARGNHHVASYVSYTPLGATKLLTGGFQAGTLTVCRISDGPTQARQVILNAVGRPRIQRANVANCEV